MRPPGSPQELERRRRRAMRLLDETKSLSEVARMVGASPSSVHRWKEAVNKHGPDGLSAKPHPGRPPRLTARHSKRLTTLLSKGALAHGWKTDLWTCPRIVVLIERHFGVVYHEDHIGRLLRRLGWSHQRPQRRARQRDEDRVARWLRGDWPRIKKTLRAGGRTSSSSTRAASRSRRR